MQTNLQGKVALITGSTKGLGRAIAVKLAQNGARVVINGRNPDSGAEVIAQLQGMGTQAGFVAADINRYPQVQALVDRVIGEQGKIDIMVASGGTPEGALAPRFFREIEPETYVDWATVQWLNRMYCVRAVLDHMIDRGGGKMILITTDAGRWPTPGESFIGGAAAALIMCTKVLAAEIARWGIRINAIATTVTPGTPGGDLPMASPAARVFQKVLEKQPFRLSPDDVAQAALFLSSPESDRITGQVLSVNGGLCFPG